MGKRSGRHSWLIDDPTIAVLMGKLDNVPPIRRELVSRIKEEIKRGQYETPEKLDIAIDRLLEDLR